MSRRAVPRLLAVVAAIALVLNAWIHFRLAGPFDANPGTLLSQGALFRIQAVVNIVVAVLLVVRPRRWTAVLAGVVAAGGAAILVITTLVPVNLTLIGLPYLFEPGWYAAKQTSLVFQLLVVALVLLALARAARRRLPAGV